MLNWTLSDFLYVIVLISTIVIRRPYIKISRSSRVTVSRFDKTEKTGLFLAFAGGFFLPLLYLFTPVFNFADYRVPALLVILGIPVNGLALWLFYRSHRDLGRQWSPKLEIRSEHLLITNGIYAFIRHPMYSSVFLFGIGQILLLGNWIVGPSYLAGFIPLYLSRINTEEALMLEEFGEDYADYMKKTGRLFSWALVRNRPGSAS